LFFYKDGRVISYNRYNRFDQHLHSFPGLRVESDTVHVARGFYEIDIYENLRIVIKAGTFGKMEYHGHIRDDDSVDLFSRCPFTWAKKSATFVRCTEKKDTSHMGLDDVCAS